MLNRTASGTGVTRAAARSTGRSGTPARPVHTPPQPPRPAGNTAAPAIAHGSFGFISNRNDFDELASWRTPTGRPIASPTAAIANTSRSTIQMSRRRCAPSAIRRADFVGSPRHAVRHRAIEPDTRDQHREHARNRCTAWRTSAPGRWSDRCADACVSHSKPESARPPGGRPRARRSRGPADRPPRGARRPSEPSDREVLVVGDIGHRRNVVFQRVIARGLRDSDDLDVRRIAAVAQS